MKKIFQSIIIIILLFSGVVYSQGPNAPEAHSFEPVDASDMVNLLTGDFSYVLPVLEVPGPGGGYPVALSYHAGIAQGQEASWVGLGWNINPGAITRTIAGVPDDWLKTKKYSVIYDKGGVARSYTGGISVGWGEGFKASAGLFASYSENKSFGGENSYNFNIGINGGVGFENSPLGLNGSISLNGISGGVGYRIGNQGDGFSIGVNVSQSFKNGGTSISGRLTKSSSLYHESATMAASLGVSLNTRGGGGISINDGVTSHSVYSGNNINTAMTVSTFDANISIPIYAVNVDIGFSKQRYWLFETDFTTYNGSLYAKEMNDLLTERPFDYKASFDSYQALSGPSRINEVNKNNFSYPSYDSYSVSGQGISGAIQPMIFEEGVLKNSYEKLDDLGGATHYYPDQGVGGDFLNTIMEKSISFYFKNENSSFLNITSSNWNLPTNAQNYSSYFDFDTTNQLLSSSIQIDGDTYNGYEPSEKRMKRGSFIEVFTNSEIKLALSGLNSINFVEAQGINRNDEVYQDHGIGGYRITTGDGKTYHYSLPVYQKEKFNRSTRINKNPEFEFYEDSQFQPYATHWLLTAITGPDYYDKNNNSTFDSDDYGYWVEFQYGKWSDGYCWRLPVGSDLELSPITKQHGWGVKEMYYLDKIKTKSHTALFIKEDRLDNLSSEIAIGSSRNNQKIYEDVLDRTLNLGDDGNYYASGLFENLNLGPNVSQVVYKIARTQHKVFIETNLHRTLKLSKIVLVDNSNALASISKSNTSSSNPIKSSEIKIDQEWEIFHLDQLWQSGAQNIVDKTYYGQYYDNVLDIQDFLVQGLDYTQGALQIVDFNQSYDLVPETPNSISISQSKLTLNSIAFKGKNGISYMPNYNFYYESPNTPYNNELKDDWGYNVNPKSWSLNKIITPIGEELVIDYEEDTFSREAAISSYIFGDGKFEMKFTGTGGGSKFVTFRNDRDNLSGQDIDFTEYFNVGESHMVDVQYYKDPYHNGGDRVADVAKICPVTNVTSTTVTFQLPTNSIQNGKRNGSSCYNDDWVYYNWFQSNTVSDDVVDKTSDWEREHNTSNCGEVGNGQSRARIKFFSYNTYSDGFGGGLRVANLTLKMENESYITSYDYTKPNSSQSSGVTSYTPSRRPKFVEYITELPPPSVMYENVSVSKMDQNLNINLKTDYHFNVLKDMQLLDDGFILGEEISLVKSQNSSHYDVNVDSEDYFMRLAKYELTDGAIALGRLKSQTSFNSLGQILQKIDREYLPFNEVSQGKYTETFKSYKRVGLNFERKLYLSSSSKVHYPNVLKKVITTENNNRTSLTYDLLDFNTGIPTETTTISSDGTIFKTKSVPAYTIPEYSGTNGGYGMGSKVDDITNFNMLSQEAANFTYKIDENGNQKILGASINTWNNGWTYFNSDGSTTTPYNQEERIWRRHKNYIWKGDLNEDGTYNGFTGDYDGFNWTVSGDQSNNSPWQKVNETTVYDHYSMPLENKDINGNYSSTKFDSSQEKVFSFSNSGLKEHFYSGAEDDIVSGYYGGFVQANSRYEDRGHTGKYCESATTSSKTFRVILEPSLHENQTSKGFKVSVWVNKGNEDKLRIKTPASSLLTSMNGEKIYADQWVLVNHYFDYPDGATNNEVYLRSSSGTILLDDFRVHPSQSAMSSYVYNEWDQITDILGANNLATKYEYDEGGRLKYTYAEVEDTPTLTGGFKKSAEFNQNYKRDISSGNDSNNELAVYFDFINENETADASTATIFGPVGSTVTLSLNVSGANANMSGLVTGHDTFSNGLYFVEIPQSGQKDMTVRFDPSNTNSCNDCGGLAILQILDVDWGSVTTNGNGTATSFEDRDLEHCCDYNLPDCDDCIPPPPPGVSITAVTINSQYLSNGNRQYTGNAAGVSGGTPGYTFDWYRKIGAGTETYLGNSGSTPNFTFNSTNCTGSFTIRCVATDSSSPPDTDSKTSGPYPFNCTSNEN